MNILVLNCGSSSIKYQLLKVDQDHQLLTKGQIDRIGSKGSNIVQKTSGFEPISELAEINDHTSGIGYILKFLLDPRHHVLQSTDQIDAVGHRIAHGGEYFKGSTLIDERAKEEISKLFDLAPLHNPANMEGILAMEKILPGKPQVGVFDTSFHQTMPEEAYLYGIPFRLYKKYNIRRYGFHGTSHQYVAEKACELLDWNILEKKIITCHLGNGASITAIKNGKSVETSMGFTPNYGLVMGTRSGVVDPAIIYFIMENEKMEIKEVIDYLNTQSGMKGLSNGLSSDMRDLALAMRDGNPDAARALNIYAHRVKHYIGAYIAEMNGVDLMVFTGGIGENNDLVRELCLKDLDYLGIAFDQEKNLGLMGTDDLVSKPDSKVKVMVIQTNEELVIARETAKLIKH